MPTDKIGQEISHTTHQYTALYHNALCILLTKVSVIILPDADHVKTSICPGVSNKMYLLSKHIICVYLSVFTSHKNKTKASKNYEF